MADQVPIKGIFNGSGDPTGLAEFTVSDTIGYADGGTGLNTLGTAGQILKVNSGATGLEWGSIVATIDIDNATDLTSSTLVSSDQILISDGGTEGRVTLSQLDTLFSGTTQTLTNKSGNISQWTNDVGYLTSFTETNDLTSAVTWANIPDANVPQSAVIQHQAALSITESQISDLQSYLTSETNDLTAAVIWANVPDANITESSVTQHEAALSIGNSQLTSGIDAAKISSGSVSNTEFDYLNGVTSNLQTQLNNKASTGFAIAMAIAL